jgi:hypothetical protein
MEVVNGESWMIKCPPTSAKVFMNHFFSLWTLSLIINARHERSSKGHDVKKYRAIWTNFNRIYESARQGI